jgi:hypothetical protein
MHSPSACSTFTFATYLRMNKFSPHLPANVYREYISSVHFFVCSEKDIIVSYCENYEKCICLYFQVITHSVLLCIWPMCNTHTDKTHNPSKLFHFMNIDSFSQICLTYPGCRNLSTRLSMRCDLMIRVSSYRSYVVACRHTGNDAQCQL